MQILGDRRNIRLKLSQKEKKVYDYLLWAKIDAVAVLKGHDEIGRVVTPKVWVLAVFSSQINQVFKV